MLVFFFCFFKQKTAYEMLISDWSSDVCSSDLAVPAAPIHSGKNATSPGTMVDCQGPGSAQPTSPTSAAARKTPADRKIVVSGKRVSVRVDLGGRRIIKNKMKTSHVSTKTSDQH